jgi:hypothetical protein
MEGTHEVEKDLALACQEAWRPGHFHKPCPVIPLEYCSKYSGRCRIAIGCLKIDQTGRDIVHLDPLRRI